MHGYLVLGLFGRIFKEIDTDASGDIDLREFLEWYFTGACGREAANWKDKIIS